MRLWRASFVRFGPRESTAGFRGRKPFASSAPPPAAFDRKLLADANLSMRGPPALKWSRPRPAARASRTTAAKNAFARSWSSRRRRLCVNAMASNAPSVGGGSRDPRNRRSVSIRSHRAGYRAASSRARAGVPTARPAARSGGTPR
ncbi:hypothetical protein [Limnoglobus roseus]|uniref:hypothetical protein n=1 Tax=Limnoglobus roseus TaxID=2598579 RepID=UPI0011EB8EBD|nr:hypothetical protein [Limnoglobus roseus]